MLDSSDFLWDVSIYEPHLYPFHAVSLTSYANIFVFVIAILNFSILWQIYVCLLRWLAFRGISLVFQVGHCAIIFYVSCVHNYIDVVFLMVILSLVAPILDTFKYDPRDTQNNSWLLEVRIWLQYTLLLPLLEVSYLLIFLAHTSYSGHFGLSRQSCILQHW